MSKSSGFTLIELLVTVSIIAVLAAIGLVAYGVVLKQGRDSKRQSDLRSIQSALEQYFADQFYYPQYSTGSNCPPANGTLRFGCSLKDPTGSKTYMNTVPTDPSGENPPTTKEYLYSPAIGPNMDSCNGGNANTCTYYCLDAKLENSDPKTTKECDSGGYNYSVSPP